MIYITIIVCTYQKPTPTPPRSLTWPSPFLSLHFGGLNWLRAPLWHSHAAENARICAVLQAKRDRRGRASSALTYLGTSAITRSRNALPRNARIPSVVLCIMSSSYRLCSATSSIPVWGDTHAAVLHPLWYASVARLYPIAYISIRPASSAGSRPLMRTPFSRCSSSSISPWMCHMLTSSPAL